MENHITSEGEKERMFLEMKENKSYILTPWEASGFHGVLLFMAIKYLQSRDFIVNSVFLLARYILSNLSIWARYHAVKDVPGYGKISLKWLLCGRGHGLGLYCGYPENESALIRNQERKKCVADYFTRGLGRTVGIRGWVHVYLWSVIRISLLF